jgi:hypothetical protein
LRRVFDTDFLPSDCLFLVGDMKGCDEMIIRSAELSACRRYRYSLTRQWSSRNPTCLFIGLNPSTADERTDDPTIRRCMRFAQGWGYGKLVMANLFAFRATDPSVLLRIEDPIGPENDKHLSSLSADAAIVIIAWGANGACTYRSSHVLKLLNDTEASAKIHCLGKTKDGHPKHPLYLPKTTEPILFT